MRKMTLKRLLKTWGDTERVVLMSRRMNDELMCVLIVINILAHSQNLFCTQHTATSTG
jgi:hypothetical protein